MNPLLAPLTDPQRQAVTHCDGPLLILAGPGSGKTRVVTHRIAHLLEQGVSATQILALTFTNKAAEEMQSRVAELAPGHPVWLSTFHRFGARLLRRYADFVGLTPNFTIYDTSDSRQTLRRLIESRQIATHGYTPDRIAAAISNAKNRLITADEYVPQNGRPLSRVVAEVYPAYQQRLLESSAVDFDDLLLHVAQLLYKNADVRQSLDSQYRYVLVDEYQDTNRAQYVILRALSVDYPNLAATGDPDQSIYGWRGADLNNILEFERDFPAVQVVRLERNFRSTQRILQVAGQLISHNQRRKQKALYTENAPGIPVRLVAYADQDDEAAGIAQRIRAALEAGTHTPSDFAIFYRVNALSRSLEKGLHAAGIPYQLVRGVEFYQRKEIKDVLAYCQLVNNPRDDIAFERTVNTPARGIGKKSIERLTLHAYQHGISLFETAAVADHVDGLSARAIKQLRAFVEIVAKIHQVAGGNVEEVIGTILDASGYRASLANSETEEDLNRLANIEELLTDARQFDEQNPGGGQLEDYLERTWLVNDVDDLEAGSDKVALMTLHAAKGLEFPVVFLVAAEQGVLPHDRSMSDPDQLEEERRLAFVGITRAKDELQLSYAVRRDFRGQRRMSIPSLFLMELPREEMELIEYRPTGRDYDFDELVGPFDQQHEEFDDLACDPEPADDFDQRHPAEREAELGPQHARQQDAADQPDRDPPTATETLTTAAAWSNPPADSPPPVSPGPALPHIAPNEFSQGMAVLHPEFGPGKIVSLSGDGKNRRATVRFPALGQKRFVLIHSPLRPVGR